MTRLVFAVPLALALLASGSIAGDKGKYVVGVSGMTWGVGCVNAVRATLTKLSKVDDVSVDFSAKTASITMKEGTLTADTVKAAFDGSRYGVTSFTAPGDKEKGQEAKKPTIYVATVTGMTWGVGCVKSVRAALTKVSNVDSVEVDFENKTATITAKSGKTLAQADVEAALKKPYAISKFVEKASKKIEKPKVVKPGGGAYTVSISGMTWGVGCAKKVRATLTKLPNVEDVKVDFDKKTADVTMKSGNDLAEDVVKTALSGAGYGVTEFKKKSL